MAIENQRMTIGIDLGGTKILAAVVDGQGKIVGRAKKKTGPGDGLARVLERVVKASDEALDSAALKRSDIQAIGIGAPGPIDGERGVVINAPNLPGWEEVPLAAELSRMVGLPVVVGNDVNVGTLGEHAYGAGRGVDDLVGIFVGTGIGGGVILGGKLRQGFRNVAGEVGHMVLLAGGPYCGCGNAGHVEALASRTAVEHALQAAMQHGRSSELSVAGSSADARLTSSVLAKAWQNQDPLTVEVLGRTQYYLGLLVGSVVNFVDPEMVILGGGLIDALGEPFLEPIRAVARQHFISRLHMDKVKIVPSQLGDDAGVIGAAHMARVSGLQNSGAKAV